MPRRAVVLSFDHLHLGFLGCYGNDWIETPNLDRLATQAVVFDRHFAENVDRRAESHAWWTGRYECLAAPSAVREPAFLAALERAAIRTSLIVESDGSDSSHIAPPFEEVIEVRGIDRLGGEESETPFGRLVLRTEEWLRSAPEDGRPSLLWLKSRGVPTPWLPPHEFGELYLEEFGLGESARSTTTADGEADEEEDAEDIEEEFDDFKADSPGSKEVCAEDERALELRYARALYAAYVSWLDRWLGKLLRTLEQSPGWGETLLIVTAAAGQGLGEHAALDKTEALLRDEFIHALLIVRLPDRRHDGTRRPSLVQTVDLPATLCDWLGVGCEVASPAAVGAADETSKKELMGRSLLPIIHNEVDSIRTLGLLHSTTEWGLRTDDFLYVEPKQSETVESIGDEGRPLLFEKPYDRWDHSDVASQYPESVEALHARLLQCCALRASPSSALTTSECDSRR